MVTEFGAEAIYTNPNCQSGTERLIELHQSGKIEGDIWVNWQGDEPFISEEMIETLLQSCENPSQEIWTLKKKITDEVQIQSPDVVKVVCGSLGEALYFSRSPIPYMRDRFVEPMIYKHVGIYAFSKSALEKMAQLPPCHLEQYEKLEQLRFLYHGLKIQVHETTQEIIGIDTKQQLYLAQRL